MTGAETSAALAAPPRVLLLVAARTYRAADFLLAATRMGLDLVIGSDGALPLGGHPVIPVSPDDPDRGAHQILARCGPVTAVVAADTPMLTLAATVAARKGLPHNSVDAILNAADKARQRQRWAAAGVAQPRFEIVPAAASGASVGEAAEAVGFPCVVKAVSLSASQGILRADDPAAARSAARRIRQVLAAARRPEQEPLLVEEYLPGPELSIDGLLTGGGLTPLAIFDKPLTLDGPTFEETLLVTPSRLPGPVLDAAIRTAGQAARALGLTSGPIHAELRVDDRGGRPRPAMLELAARSIGGLCSRALHLPGGASLEELVLGNALGQPVPATGHNPDRPAGVFMLPVPSPGVLRAVEGKNEAMAVPGITGLTITIPIGQRVLPLPEGDRYLGFIFAEADSRPEVEQALTTARDRLRVVIALNISRIGFPATRAMPRKSMFSQSAPTRHDRSMITGCYPRITRRTTRDHDLSLPRAGARHQPRALWQQCAHRGFLQGSGSRWFPRLLLPQGLGGGDVGRRRRHAAAGGRPPDTSFRDHARAVAVGSALRDGRQVDRLADLLRS